MRTKILPLIFIFIIGCNNTDNQISKDITNKITVEHTRIPGTHVYMKIPIDFQIIDGFSRIRVNENTIIEIIDQKGGNYAFDEKDITRKNFVHPGFKVKEDYSFYINNYNSRLVRLDISYEEDRYQMVIGDTTFSLVFMSSFPSNDKLVAKKIKNCLLSTFYDKSAEIMPFESAIFNLDYSNTGFELAQHGSAQYVLIKNSDSSEVESNFNTVYTILQMPYDHDYISDIQGFARSNLDKSKSQGIKNLEIQYEKEFLLNGNKAYKHICWAKYELEKILFYQVVIGSKKGIVIIYGLTFSEHDKDLKNFEMITSTIKL